MKLPEALKLVTDTLWRIQSEKEFGEAMEALLTPSEITEMADRIRILQMLHSGKSQREIAEMLEISVTTVSRGNRVLQYGNESIIKYL